MEPNTATAAKPVKIPGPDHPIAVERNPARIVISLAGRVVADTREALTLREAAYPRCNTSRARMSIWRCSPDRSRHLLPIQGRLQLFQHSARRRAFDNAVWSYEAPYAAVAAIKDYLAFYPNRVDAIEERPEAEPFL